MPSCGGGGGGGGGCCGGFAAASAGGGGAVAAGGPTGVCRGGAVEAAAAAREAAVGKVRPNVGFLVPSDVFDAIGFNAVAAATPLPVAAALALANGAAEPASRGARPPLLVLRANVGAAGEAPGGTGDCPEAGKFLPDDSPENPMECPNAPPPPSGGGCC